MSKEQSTPMRDPIGDISAPESLTRRSKRTRTVLKTVKVQIAGDEGLARLQNISDDGMKLALKLSICIGDVVTVFLSDVDRVEGRVVWTEGEHCGLQIAETIDSSALLIALAERLRDGSSRPVRMATATAAVAYSDTGIHAVQVKDISQRGLKLQHHANFAEGLSLKVQLATGLELRGIVRWSNHDLAGIELLEPVSVEQLGSSNSL